jgi:hypothetical protein
MNSTPTRPTALRKLATVATLALAFIALSPASAGAGPKNAAEFYAHVAGGKTVSCAIYDGYADSTEALCEFVTGHTQAKATLSADGSVTLCRTHSATSNRCELGNAGEGSPTYAVGKKVQVGRFACVVQGAGVRCTVAATGKGFLLGPKRLRGVGGASVQHR